MNDEQTYLAFVWTPAGYELREERGELPASARPSSPTASAGRS